MTVKNKRNIRHYIFQPYKQLFLKRHPIFVVTCNHFTLTQGKIVVQYISKIRMISESQLIRPIHFSRHASTKAKQRIIFYKSWNRKLFLKARDVCAVNLFRVAFPKSLSRQRVGRCLGHCRCYRWLLHTSPVFVSVPRYPRFRNTCPITVRLCQPPHGSWLLAPPLSNSNLKMHDISDSFI